MEIALKMADKDQYDSEMLVLLQPYLVKLPKPHLVLLIYLLKFLLHMTQYSETTKMDSNNLAIVFASNIIRPEEETMEATLKYNHVNNLVKHMIDHVNELEDMIPTLKEKKDSEKSHDWLQEVIRHTKQNTFYVDEPSPRPPSASEDEPIAPPYIPKPPDSDPPPLIIPGKEGTPPLRKAPSHKEIPHEISKRVSNLKDSPEPTKKLLTAASQPATVNLKNVKEYAPSKGDTGDISLDSKVGKVDLAASSDGKGSSAAKSPTKRPIVFHKKGEKGEKDTPQKPKV